MKFALSLGVALAALTLAASADSNDTHVFIRHGGMDLNLDADSDGWLTRAEAAAAAERMYDEMDANDDGRLDGEDHSARAIRFNFDHPDVRIFHGDDGERRVIITRDGEDVDEAEIEAHIERAMEEAERHIERAERHAEQAERHAERAERQAEEAERRVERHVDRHVRRAERDNDVERNVIILRGGEGGEWESIAPVPPMPPVPPIAPHAPMFMMLIANSEEADLNSDGALSRDEFRAQQLRFFDASDANGDGRIRFEEPPAPPAPPAAPTPPEPPRRR